MSDLVLVSRERGTVTMVLNRPDRRNALSHSLLSALNAVLIDVPDTGVDEVIITGAGACFSAGADYRELTGTIKDIAIDEAIARVTRSIRETPVEVTALVNGPCLGGAVDLALSCDKRVATADAWFQVPATRLGLLYNPVSVQRMVVRYGRDIVHRLLVKGEQFDAHAALSSGLVSEVSSSGKANGNKVQNTTQVPTNHISEVTTASEEMINAIDSGKFDPDYWEKVRRRFLRSSERFEAVTAFKARMQVKGNH